MTEGAELLGEIRELRAAIDRLAIAVGGEHQRGKPSKADVARLTVLLPLIRAGWPNTAVFATGDLWEDSEPAVRARLLQALGARSGAKALGRLFARAEGHAVNGLAVRRGERMRDGQTWFVESVSATRGVE